MRMNIYSCYVYSQHSTCFFFNIGTFGHVLESMQNTTDAALQQAIGDEELKALTGNLTCASENVCAEIEAFLDPANVATLNWERFVRILLDKQSSVNASDYSDCYSLVVSQLCWKCVLCRRRSDDQ